VPDIPTNAARNEQSQEAYRRLAEIHAVLSAVQRGTVCERAALGQIEEIARGAADRIVRVGPAVVPDIQTSREGDR